MRPALFSYYFLSFALACGPLVDDRDVSPATPTRLEGELELDGFEGASRFALSRLRYAWLIAPGDLDGDSLDDLVILERQRREDQRGFVHIFLGSSTPLPRELRPSDADVSFELGDGFGPFDRPRTIGDLDGDGRAEFAIEHDPYVEERDLVIFRWEDVRPGRIPTSEAGVRLGTADAGEHVFVWSAGDLDGDEIDDLWLDLGETGSVFIPGSADFFTRDQSVLDFPLLPLPPVAPNEYLTQRDFADLDGDGHPESIVEIGNVDGNDRIEVRAVDPHRGADTEPSFILPVSSNWGALQPGNYEYRSHTLDYNGDGILDLFLALSEPGASLLFGGVPLTAETMSSYPTSTYEFDVAGDVDGDGFDDLLLLPHDVGGVGRVHLFYGNSAGTMSPGATFRTRDELGLGVNPIPAGDLNGDGFDDFVLSHGTFLGDADNTPNAYLDVIYGAPR